MAGCKIEEVFVGLDEMNYSFTPFVLLLQSNFLRFCPHSRRRSEDPYYVMTNATALCKNV